MLETRNVTFWSSWWRVAGLAGIVCGLAMLGVTAWLFFATPGFAGSVADVRRFLTESGTLYLAADFVMLVLIVLFLPLFGAGLRGYLGRAEGGYGMWSRLVFGGAVLTAASALVGGLFWRSMAFGGVEGLSDGALRSFMYLNEVAYSTAVPLAFALMLLGASVVIIRTGALTPWLGWFGLIATLALAVGAGWLIDRDPDGALAYVAPIGLAIGLVWTILVGWALVLKLELPPHVPGEGLFAPAGIRRAGKGQEE